MKVNLHQECCPSCKGTTFTVALADVQGFWSQRVRFDNKDPDLVFEVLTCTSCGWKNHLLDKKGLNKTMDIALYIASISNSDHRRQLLDEHNIPHMELKG